MERRSRAFEIEQNRTPIQLVGESMKRRKRAFETLLARGKSDPLANASQTLSKLNLGLSDREDFESELCSCRGSIPRVINTIGTHFL